MGDNQNARLAQAIGRLLNQKDRSTLSTVLEDIFPVYVLDDLTNPENAYQQSRDWWWIRASQTGAAGDNAGVCLVNGSAGSLIVIDEVFVWSTAANFVWVSGGPLFAGSAYQSTACNWGDDRNSPAGPPALQLWTTTTAGAPAGFTVPIVANVLTRLPIAPIVMRGGPGSLGPLRFSTGTNATLLGVFARGYERPWEPSDA